MDKISELLKPRYKVIADYPNSHYDIGEIIKQNDKFMQGLSPSVYPAIFQPLEWYEERSPDEMPEFVKFLRRYREVKKGEIIKVDRHDERYFYIDGLGKFIYGNGEVYPATLQEYNEYKNKK